MDRIYPSGKEAVNEAPKPNQTPDGADHQVGITVKIPGVLIAGQCGIVRDILLASMQSHSHIAYRSVNNQHRSPSSTIHTDIHKAPHRLCYMNHLPAECP